MILIPGTKVTVSMKGLAVANYDKANQNWDFAFLRGIADHDLRITVREYRLGSPSMKILYDETDFSKSWKNISFLTTNVLQNPKPEYSENQTFSYLESVDNYYDTRWISDLSELHQTQTGAKEPVKLKKPIFPKSLTFLSISAATLYSKVLHDKPYYVYDTSDLTKPKYTRTSSSWAGLDIKWEGNSSTNIVIEKNKVVELKESNSDSNLLHYEIEVNNNCNKDSSTSDFRHYYENLMAMPITYDEFFEPIKTPFSAEKVYDGKTNDCGIKHISVLDGGKRLEDTLKP
jgi:hypothetical protein